jgi:hypothetical protein
MMLESVQVAIFVRESQLGIVSPGSANRYSGGGSVDAPANGPTVVPAPSFLSLPSTTVLSTDGAVVVMAAMVVRGGGGVGAAVVTSDLHKYGAVESHFPEQH